MRRNAIYLADYYLRRFKNRILYNDNNLEWLRSIKMNFNISIDVGANRGYYASVLIKKSKFVIVVEPIPYLIRYLKKVLNRDKCIFINKAASNYSGVGLLRIPVGRFNKDITSLSTLSPYNSLYNNKIKKTKSLEVELTTLDKIVDSNNYGKVDFIKIDCEGNEESVLLGSKKLISKHRPIFQVELEEKYGTRIKNVFDYFKRNDYSSYFINSDIDLISISYKKYIVNECVTDVIFIPD